MFFKQIKQYSDNFSYIIADENTKETAIIDSSYNTDEIIQTIKNNNLKPKYIINTHDHYDHVDGNEEIKNLYNAKIITHKQSKTPSDQQVNDNDTIALGNISIKIIHTPGHTPDSICLLINNQILLTGDTLFVGECGRTDLPGGSPTALYHSFFDKILRLDDDILVYPGHDYGPKPYSTIGEERKHNYVLQPRSLSEFISFMRSP
jgi:glyoxylase-like metal-dependent hydrolase (beta-lactamase superfamily II)